MPRSCIISSEIMQRLQNFLAAEFPVTPALVFADACTVHGVKSGCDFPKRK